MRRRQFICSAVVAALALTARKAGASETEMTIYKDPNCGCCHAWAEAMKDAGYAVTVKDVDDLSQIKAQYSVPEAVQGCHTAITGSYFIEGHVPLEAVQRLLREAPELAGVAVPGMPSGSLGMGEDAGASYDVFSVSRSGETAIYQSVRPKA